MFKRLLIIMVSLAAFSVPAIASYMPFNTNVNMNVGIGTSTPAGALTVMNGNVGIGTWVPGSLLAVNGNASVDTLSSIDSGYPGYGNLNIENPTGFPNVSVGRGLVFNYGSTPVGAIYVDNSSVFTIANTYGTLGMDTYAQSS